MAEDDDQESSQHHVHYFQEFPQSFALLSPNPSAATAIVFVHGFGGDACQTWANFQILVDQVATVSEAYLDCDLYFFQYESVGEGIGSSVNRLEKLLTALVPRPNAKYFELPSGVFAVGERDQEVAEEDLGNGTLTALSGDRLYSSILLVGHSEGGVVIRKMLVDAEAGGAANRAELLESHLALFAPAIFGYKPSGLLGMLANAPFLGEILDAFLKGSPAYYDLKEPELLKELSEQTKRLARESAFAAFKATILWGRQDRVVKDGKYPMDTSDYEDDHGHISICKPSAVYERPLLLLVDALRRKP